MRGDRLRVERALVNLLENAAKYAAGAPVLVRAARDAAAVAIEVRDGGPGIAPGGQARIFERYERAVVDGYKASVLGLGLYIARELARAHGGELSVRSAPGEGATFVLTLPAAT